MGDIQALLDVNIVSVVLSVLVIIFAFVSVVDLIVKFSDYIGKPVKWFKKRSDDHEAIAKLTTTVDQLKTQQDTDREQSIAHDHEIKSDLEELTNMFVMKNIEDMRWRILDFGSAISNGRKFNKESYDFVLKTYDEYEEILERRHETNGVIELTVNFIKEKYQENLRNGFNS